MGNIFAQKLKELRTERKITQKKLAEIMRVSSVTISHWENQEQEPCLDDVIKLAYLFNVSTDYLLGKENDMCLKDSAIAKNLGDGNSIINNNNGKINISSNIKKK